MGEKDSQLPIAEVEFNEAKMLADHYAIIEDLKFVIEALKRLLEIFDSNSNEKEDRVIIESFWTSAIVIYARCFATGKRYGLTETIFEGLKGEPIKAHNYYIDLRNKHVAHSVNPFEQMKVGLILSKPEDKNRKILGVANLRMKHNSASRSGIETLLMLSQHTAKWIGEKAKNYHKKTIEIAKSMPIETFYSNLGLKIKVPGPEDTGTARK